MRALSVAITMALALSVATTMALATPTAFAAEPPHLSKISAATLDRYNATLADATSLIGPKVTSIPAQPQGASGNITFSNDASKCLPDPTPNYMSTNAVGEVDSPSFTSPPRSGVTSEFSSSALPSSGNGEAEAAKLPSMEKCLEEPIKALFISSSTPTEPLKLSRFSGSVLHNTNLPKGSYGLKFIGEVSSGTSRAHFLILVVAAGHGNAVALYIQSSTYVGPQPTYTNYKPIENSLSKFIKSKVGKVNRLAL